MTTFETTTKEEYVRKLKMIKHGKYKVNGDLVSERKATNPPKWYIDGNETDGYGIIPIAVGLEKVAIASEGKMMRDDSCIEIDIEYIEDSERIFICDYSESRGSSELIVDFCPAECISKEEIEAICNKHGWYLVA